MKPGVDPYLTEEFAIRTATVGDATELARLAAELGYPMSSDEMKSRLSLVLDRSEHFVVVADRPNGRLAGWAHVEHRRSLAGGERAELMGLVVDASMRRVGLGRQLIDVIEAWASDRGLMSITVRSNVARSSSHPFYAAAGYNLQKTQNVYIKSLCGDS